MPRPRSMCRRCRPRVRSLAHDALVNDLVGPATALGATYALIGAAVAIVAVATRTLHLAVGQILVAGVLVSLVLGSAAVGLPPVVVVGAALLVGAAVSALLGPLVLGRLPGGLPWLLGLVVAAATLDAISARWLTTTVFRPQPLIPLPAVDGLDPAVATAVVVGVPGVLVLATLLGATRWGRRVRLVGGSPATAERAGISPGRVRSEALAVGGAAAVLAGLLAAPVTFVSTGQATGFTVRGVAAAALVGSGGPAWALAGGLLLGVSEVAGANAWPEAGGEVGVAVAVVAVLVVRGGSHLQAWGRAW